MNEIEKIEQWKPPVWHKDFGDPSLELSLLKELCLQIVKLGFNYCFVLDCFEEGYLNVNVFKDDKLIFEAYVTDPEEHKIGLFFQNGDEIYIHEVEEIKNHLK